MSIDLAGLTAVCFRADAFSSLELISIGPTCRLRKIFTMKDGLDDWEDRGGEDQEKPVDGATAPGGGRKRPVCGERKGRGQEGRGARGVRTTAQLPTSESTLMPLHVLKSV